MNLYEISQDLMGIYAQIEDNDGEITPEIEEALNIGEDNLREKLRSYSGLIKSLKADVENCAAEAKRLAEYKKRKEKLIEKLSNIVAEAVCKFGTLTKSGGANIDLGTEKITVRATNKCEVFDDRVDAIKDALNTFIYRMKQNRLLGTVDFTQDFLNSVSGIGVDDLATLEYNISFRGTALEMTEGKINNLLAIISDVYNGVIDYSVSKTNCKNAIADGKRISYATVTPNKLITIK